MRANQLSTMRDYSGTIRALAQMSDEGLFEQLATAVLRDADPGLYGSLTHPGVNADGKTVKAPVDGLSFLPGAHPPHLVAVHHTICARDDLEKKWLHDPSTVVPRKGTKPAAPAGDVLKTAGIIAKERIGSSDLRATLALTTNEEPPEELTRNIAAAA